MDLISVIMPVYKVEQFIRQAINSVIHQTYQNLEIILIDDGSPDNCGSICDEYANQDSRVKVIHKENGGAPAARNTAIDICSGDWIAYVDPDDWIELNAFEEVMRTAAKDSPDIIIFNTYINTDTEQRPIQAFEKDFVTDDRSFIQGLQLSSLYKRYTPKSQTWSQGFPWDKVFRTSLIKGNKIYWPTNVRANDDVIYTIHAFQYATRISYINQTFYHYRFNPGSIGHRFMPDRMQVDKEIYSELLRIRDKYQLGAEYNEALNARIVRNMWLGARRYFFHPDNPKAFMERYRELSDTLKEEPFYSAFDKVDRSKLTGGEKYITLFRHNNAVWIYLLQNLGKLALRMKGEK